MLLRFVVFLDFVVKNIWIVFGNLLYVVNNIIFVECNIFSLILYFFFKLGMNIWCEVGVFIEVLYLIILIFVDMI